MTSRLFPALPVYVYSGGVCIFAVNSELNSVLLLVQMHPIKEISHTFTGNADMKRKTCRADKQRVRVIQAIDTYASKSVIIVTYKADSIFVNNRTVHITWPIYWSKLFYVCAPLFLMV